MEESTSGTCVNVKNDQYIFVNNKDTNGLALFDQSPCCMSVYSTVTSGFKSEP